MKHAGAINAHKRPFLKVYDQVSRLLKSSFNETRLGG